MVDYKHITDKIFYQENQSKLEKLYNVDQFSDLDISTKKEIANKLKLDFKFLLTMYGSIAVIYPIVENFILTSDIPDVNTDKDTVVYLTICLLAIIFDNPKETYRKLFSELRLRNVYGLLKDLTMFISVMVNIFNYITFLSDKIIYDIVGMLNYPDVFVPFSLSFLIIIRKNKIALEDIANVFDAEGAMVLTKNKMGATGITMRQIILATIEKMVSEFDNTFMTKLKGKLSDKDIDKDLKSKEIDNPNDVLNWTAWKQNNDLGKDVERIDEEK